MLNLEVNKVMRKNDELQIEFVVKALMAYHNQQGVSRKARSYFDYASIYSILFLIE